MRTGKTLTLFVSNKDMNDIIQIIDSLEDSGVLIGGVTEAVKHEIKKKISCRFVSTFSHVINATSNRSRKGIFE